MAPGALGIVTDATGLFLIAIAPIPVMERFALFCGFWALILVPANLFLSPILLSWFPAPKNVKTLLGKEEGAKFHKAVVNLLERFQTEFWSGCSFQRHYFRRNYRSVPLLDAANPGR